mgnify:FL=1
MFYDLFKKLCDDRNISVSKACIEIGLSRSIAAKWKNTKTNPSADVLPKIAKYFGVSVDYLLGAEEKMPALTSKDERDISKKLEEALSQLESSQEGLMFQRKPFDDATKELIAISLRNSLEMGKKLAKQKFTPKKYKGEQ